MRRALMILMILGLWTFLRAVSTGAAAVTLENLALRHQLLLSLA